MTVKPCGCGWGCDYKDIGGPCWGQVHVLDEVPTDDGDWTWVHGCDGHDGMLDGKPYKVEGASNV